MADEEPVNPQLEVEESCKPQCVKAWLEYEASGLAERLSGGRRAAKGWCRPAAAVLAAAAASTDWHARRPRLTWTLLAVAAAGVCCAGGEGHDRRGALHRAVL